MILRSERVRERERERERERVPKHCTCHQPLQQVFPAVIVHSKTPVVFVVALLLDATTQQQRLA